MKTRNVFVGVVLALAPSRSEATDFMVGVVPSDGTTMLVKQLALDPGTAIRGIEFGNNDARTTFPEVLLVRDIDGAVSDGIVSAREVSAGETSPGLVRVLWSEPVIVDPRSTYYAVVRIPAGSGKEGPGAGAAIAAKTVDVPTGSFVAGGSTGELTAIRADLSILPLIGTASKVAGPKSPQQEKSIPRTFLAGGTPNPSTSAVTIQFGVDRRTHVVLEIYDVAGKRVRGILAAPIDAGTYSRGWDGRNDQGKEVASGLYIARLRAGSMVLTQKLLLTK